MVIKCMFFLYLRVFSGRYEKNNDKKCLNEISKRELMAKSASKIGKYQIVDFLRLKNLELESTDTII